MDKMLNIISGYGLDYININQSFSRILGYKAASDEGICEDCEEWYVDCCCEGDREQKDSFGNNLACRYCFQNRCICDYNLDTEDDVIREIANLAKIWFDNNQLDTFVYLILTRLKITFSKNSKERLKKLLNLLGRKSNPKRKYVKRK